MGPIEFTTAVVSEGEDGRIVIAAIDGPMLVKLLTCSRATAEGLLHELVTVLYRESDGTDGT